MIHLFDGFNWPIDSNSGSASASTPLSNQPPTAFILPYIVTRGANNGKGRLSVYSSSNGCGVRVTSRNSFQFAGGKLVVGGSYQLATTAASNVFGLLLTNALNTPTADFYATTNFPYDRTDLPSLVVNQTSLHLKESTSSTSSTVTTGVIATKEMTGISSSVDHWYETEYDAIANVINVYIDGALVWTVPYTFTDAQKNASYRLGLHAYTAGSTGTQNPLNIIAGYAADEVVGPCRVVARYATSDVNVSPAFGAAPNFSKMNIAPITDIATALTTKENASAEFGTGGETITGAVKAVGIFSKAATTNRSSYETEAKITYQLRLNGSLWARAPLTLPNPSVAPLAIHTTFLSVNPVTNQSFTPADVNNMNLGLSFEMTNKFTELK